MITRIWSGTSRLYLLLVPFSWLYKLITFLIKFSYRCGCRKIYYFPIPIIVIGNLTVGGTGKTPMVLWLVKQLQKRGWRVGVISRGYGGRSAQYPILLNSNVDSFQCGDEPLLIWQKSNRIPVAVAPKRAEAVAALLKNQSLDIIVSDDGLQHYSLGRDIEWVVIDGDRRFGNGWCLPAGMMRESTKRLRQVQAIIVNGGNKIYPGEISMKLIASNKAVNLLTGKNCLLTKLKPIIAIAGIGYPNRFFSTIRKMGVIPIREVSFSDHQIYQESTLIKLVSNNEQLLMTEKDSIKCQSFAHANWWFLPVNASLSKVSEKMLLTSVEQVIMNYKNIKNNIKSKFE